jgi:hypothetical protein
MLKQFQELNEAIHFFPIKFSVKKVLKGSIISYKVSKRKIPRPSAFSCTGYSTLSVNSMPRAAWSPTGQ